MSSRIVSWQVTQTICSQINDAPFSALYHRLGALSKSLQRPLGSKVQRLLIGTLLACGRRAVTAAIRHTGKGYTPYFSLYHHVFNRVRWSARKGSLLFLWVQTSDAAAGSLTFVIDLIVTPSGKTRCWAVAVLSVHAPIPQVSERLGLRHNTVAQRVSAHVGGKARESL